MEASTVVGGDGMVGSDTSVQECEEPKGPGNRDQYHSGDWIPSRGLGLRQEHVHYQEDTAGDDAGEEEDRDDVHSNITFPSLIHGFGFGLGRRFHQKNGALS